MNNNKSDRPKANPAPFKEGDYVWTVLKEFYDGCPMYSYSEEVIEKMVFMDRRWFVLRTDRQDFVFLEFSVHVFHEKGDAFIQAQRQNAKIRDRYTRTIDTLDRDYMNQKAIKKGQHVDTEA